MLAKNNRDAELVFHAQKALQEVVCRNRVKLCGRLVQNQQLRREHERGSKVYELLLPARQLGGVFVKQVGNPEKCRRFRDACADFFGRLAEIFEREGKLVPDLVADKLAVGILHNKADALRLLAGSERVDLPAVV